MSVNKVIIIGNLGADPDIKVFNNGGKIASISVATSEKWTDRTTGEKREHTEWHRIIFNDRLADIAEQYLRKGSKVYVEGSLRTRKWQDPQTGQDRYATEIRAQNMQMLDSRGNQDGYGNNNYNSYNNSGYNNNGYNNNYNNNNHNNGYGNQGGYQGNNYNNNPRPNQRNQGGYPNNQYQGNQAPDPNYNPMAGEPSSSYHEPDYNPADDNNDDLFDNDNSINNTPNDNSFGTPNDDYPPAKTSKNSTKLSTDIDDDDMPF